METTKGRARVEYELLDDETVYPTPMKNRVPKKIAHRVSDVDVYLASIPQICPKIVSAASRLDWLPAPKG